MTKTADVSPQAKKDLEDIWCYIAADNPIAADRVERELYEAFEKLALNPNMGHKREDITFLPVRFWRVFSYHIIYKAESDTLEILRILSGYRDLETLLND